MLVSDICHSHKHLTLVKIKKKRVRGIVTGQKVSVSVAAVANKKLLVLKSLLDQRRNIFNKLRFICQNYHDLDDSELSPKKIQKGYFQIITNIKDKNIFAFLLLKQLLNTWKQLLFSLNGNLKFQTKWYYRSICSAKLLLSFLLPLLNKKTITVQGENYQQRRLDVHVKHMRHLKATCFTECKICQCSCSSAATMSTKDILYM